MPLYNFRCTDEKCEHEFEQSVKLTEFDTKVIVCEKCGKEARRALTAMPSTHTSWKHWRL